MLNPFPNLLFLSYFAPTLLRLAAALVIAFVAYTHIKNRGALSNTKFPIVGKGAWIVWASIVVEAAVAAGLLFGYGTQLAALLGAVLGLKYSAWAGRYPQFFVLSRIASLLLLVICLSLLVTGAGAFAMDLPL